LAAGPEANLRFLLGVLALFWLSLFGSGSREHRSAEPPQGSTVAAHAAVAGVPVVVELFTSEGCSSCPPADALLVELEEQQPVANAQILAVEEHVDYWNNLGWTDPFSSRQWTARQEDYAATLGNHNVYTPQMVIDGRTEFVGGREHQTRQAIEEATSRVRTPVSVTARRGEKEGWEQFTVSVGKLAGNKLGDTPEVWLAITEAGLHSSVTRGENAGEELHHASVVRALRKIGVADQNKETSLSADLSLAPAWKPQNLRAVVFIQEKKSRQILGASATHIDR
jgi:hypothetical protein